jgi:hypothetical protein
MIFAAGLDTAPAGAAKPGAAAVAEAARTTSDAAALRIFT